MRPKLPMFNRHLTDAQRASLKLSFSNRGKVRFFSLKAVGIGSVIFGLTAVGIFSWKGYTHQIATVQQKDQSVLGDSTAALTPLDGNINFNIPAVFGSTVSMQDINVQGVATFGQGITLNNKDLNIGNGKITASNIIYGLTAGKGISVNSNQSPTIANTGVTALQGSSGDVSLSAGDGITISGLSIANGDKGSSQKIFSTVAVGANSTTAGNNTATLTFAAGSGISVALDTTNKKITITNTASSGGGYTAYAVLYADAMGNTTSLTPGTSGYILQSNGSGAAPSWVPSPSLSSLSFSAITTGINTSNTLTVGNGSTLTTSGTGLINANQLNGQTTSLGGALTTGGAFTTSGANALTLTTTGTTTLTLPTSGTVTALGNTTTGTGSLVLATSPSLITPNIGAATATTVNGLTLTANATGFSVAGGTTSKTLTMNNTLTLAGTDGTTLTFQGSDTYVGRATTDTLTNKTLAAGNNTITGLTNSNLSGTAGITNANLANSSLTVTAGTGLLGGGSVSLGSSVSLSLPQTIATSSTPTFAGLTINGNIQLTGGTSFLTTLTSAATTTRTITLPDAAGTICLSGQTCASSGTVGYWQRTTLGGYTYLAPSTIADVLSIGQTTGLTATGLNVKVNSLGNAAAYVENSGGLGDLFTASSAGATKFIINNNGYVGLGTTTPAYSLSIVNGVADTIHAGQPGNQDLFRVDNSGHVSASAYNYNNNSFWFVNFSGGQTSLPGYLTLNNAGGTNPFATLDVRANTGSNFGTTPIASFSGQTSFAGLVVDNSGKGDLFTASSSGLNRFVITQNGNVGIGTSTPARILDVVGTAVENGSGTSSQLSIRGTASTVNKLNIGYDTTNNWGFIEAVQESVAWQNLILQPSGGNIGLGATAPASKLSVNGGVSIGNAYITTAAPSNGLIVSGNVGLGTNNPLATLDVRGTSGTTPIASLSGQTSFAGFVVDNKGVGDLFTASSSGATRFVINNNGNLTSSAGSQWKPSSDSTIGLQIANSSGTPLINFDTTNSFLKLGTGTSIYSGGTCKGTGVNEACAPLHVVANTGNHNIIFENTGPNLLTLANASGGIPYEWTFNVSANQLGDFSVADGNGFTPFYIAPNPNWMAIGRGFYAPKAVLHVQGGNTGGNAGLIVNQTGASTNDIIAASASGVTKFVVNSSGNVGIGTSSPNYTLDIQNSVAATAAAQIYNTNTTANSGGLIVKLGYTGNGTVPTSQTTGNNFMRFLNGNGIAQGSINSNGSGGITYATGGVDFAEYYKKALTSEQMPAGAVICLSPNGVTICNNGGNILGIVSDRAGFAGGAEHAGDSNYVLVGLVGQLPVKVATTSGTITAGDPITASTNGTAVKATTAGQIIGHALTSSQDTTDGTIMVSVNVSWYDPNFYTSATTGVLGTSAQSLIDPLPLTTSTATISGTLNVLGRTTVRDLGVTGNISAGLLTIDGLNSDVNTLAGDLKLQSQGLGGIDILHGKVTIDTSGNMTTVGTLKAQTVTTDKINISNTSTITSTTVLSASAGVVTIPAGQTTLDIHTNKLTSNSLIFVTPDVPVAIAAKKIDETTFRISLGTSSGSDLHVNWWVVN